MEKTDTTYKAWGIEEGVHEACGLKPMLSPCEQIALLKEKGVAFNRCDEEAAIEALSQKGTYLHIASYRRLFQKHESGPQKGKYVNLDFADLVYLDELDGDARRAFLLASQDVERLAKTALVTRISEDSSEDGYSIVADFMNSLEQRYRNNIVRDLSSRINTRPEMDVYSGRIIEHYRTAMPVWAFLEVVTFGTLLAFYLFCSRRWNDALMREIHYVLKGVKSIRNCTSHGSCILNGMDSSFDSNYALSSLVYGWLNEKGMPNNKTRRSKLQNRRIQQLLETLVMFDHFDGPELCPVSANGLNELKDKLLSCCLRYGDQNSFVSYLRFLANLIDMAA